MDMNIFKSGFGVVLVMLVVVTMLGGACGPQEAAPPSANQPPMISSLAADPSGIVSGGSTTITCIATDPDGDAISYSWSASEGSITGGGNKVTWVAPKKDGSFNIAVIVRDGKGGETTGNVTVTVSAPTVPPATKTVTLTPIAKETWTARIDGTTDNSRTWAGDDEKDRGYRAFWSFDASNLAGKKIQNATLKFPTPIIGGNPFDPTEGLGGLRFWKAQYGTDMPVFSSVGTNLVNTNLMFTPPTELDVTLEVGYVADATSPRFQVEALFINMVTNGNHRADFIEWPAGVVLEVTYSE
jgi:hypothetical protein